MTRRTKLAVAGGLTLTVLLLYAGVVVLAKSAVDTMQALTVPPETLLTLAELPPGFAADPDSTRQLGIEAIAIRSFWVPEDQWDGGPYAVTHTVVRMVVATDEERDVFLDTQSVLADVLGTGDRMAERVEGPNLGHRTAWRRLVDADHEDPADALVVAVQSGAWFSILQVDAYREDLSVDEVAALARPLVARLDAVATR